MSEIKEKLPTIRILIFLVAFIAVFEITILFVMIPSKNAFHWISAGVIAITLIYLIVICLKLWRELRDALDKK